jgi:hypothetical protein
MNSTLGVTRWLVAPRWIVMQAGLILLLLGVVVGLVVERWVRPAPPAQAACAVEPPRPVAGAVEPALAPLPVASASASEPVRGPGATPPEPPPAPARRSAEALAPTLARSERWITTASHDGTRRGYSVWAVLRPGGSLVVERCRAPDWTSRSMALPAPVCDVVLDQVVAAVGESRIELRNGRTFRYALERRDGEELLRLSLAEELELVPGSRSTLVAHLGYLPADAPARARWARAARGQRVARAAK